MILSKSGLSPKQKRLLLIGQPLVLIILYSLVSFLLYPLYTRVSSDVLTKDGWLPVILDYCMTFILYLAVITVISSVAFAFCKRSRAAIWLSLTAFICILYYYVSSLTVSWIKDNASVQTVGRDLLGALRSTGLELIVPAAAIAAVMIFAFAAKNKNPDEYNVFTFSHEIVVSALAGGVSIAVSRVFQRVVYDVKYGAPESASEVLYMIVAYLMDLLLGFAAYLAIYYIEKCIDKKRRC